ncbi:MAG: LacI family DNA-binding transcriptional regulator [Spirochaetales bacterium]
MDGYIPTKRKKKVKLEEIAEKAGVSRSTVSLVLRGSPLISSSTTDKVRIIAAQLGYVYNRAAASLRNRKSHVVGLIEANFKNPFFAAMSETVERELDQKGKAILFTDSAESLERQQKALRLMVEHGVDGILLCPVKRTTAEDLSFLKEYGIPCVFFSRYIPGVDADFVGAANFSGAFQAVKRFIELGHRRILFVGGEPTTSPWFDRFGGFKKALEEGGGSTLEPLCMHSEVSLSGGARVANTIIELNPLPTAILCYSDSVALGVMLGLEKRGILPGRDIAIIGFDDLPVAKLWRPPLATLACPPAQIGSWATRVLLERMEGHKGEGRKIEIPTVLLERASLCSVPSGAKI